MSAVCYVDEKEKENSKLSHRDGASDDLWRKLP